MRSRLGQDLINGKKTAKPHGRVCSHAALLLCDGRVRSLGSAQLGFTSNPASRIYGRYVTKLLLERAIK